MSLQSTNYTQYLQFLKYFIFLRVVCRVLGLYKTLKPFTITSASSKQPGILPSSTTNPFQSIRGVRKIPEPYKPLQFFP